VHFGVILPNYGTGSSADGIRRLADLNAAAAKAAALEANVTDAAAVEALVAQIVERFGRLEVLVNNAGIEKSQPLLEIDESSWDRTLAVDLKGPLLCLQAAARRMKESGGGSIVNISFDPRGLPVPEAEEVAEVALFLASDRSSYVTGSTYFVDTTHAVSRSRT
jgi:NAD(P)-dependent dehydrogenase (short-subunit alcohol dehydrogenase family)